MSTKKAEENLDKITIREGYDISRVIVISQSETKIKVKVYFQTESMDYYYINACIEKSKLKKM